MCACIGLAIRVMSVQRLSKIASFVLDDGFDCFDDKFRGWVRT